MASVLLLGYGERGSVWHQGLVANGHEVVQIVDPDSKSVLAIPVKPTLSEVSLEGIDWVVDASPPQSHFRNIVWASAKNLPIIVESPMVASPEHLYSLLGAYNVKRDCKLFVSQPRRYDQFIHGLHDWIKEEKIERIHLEICSPMKLEGWRKKLQSPFVEEMLIHLVDTSRHLAREAVFTEIQAVSVRPNTISCVGAMTRDIAVTLHGSWDHAGYQTAKQGFWMVTTEKGNYTFKGEYVVGPMGTVRSLRTPEDISGVIHSFEDYLKSDNQMYPASYQHNAQSMETVFEVYMQMGLFADR